MATGRGKQGTRARRAAASRTSADGRRDQIVVYVHGIGRQAPPDALKLEWDLALFGSDREDRTRMAYWSDVLHGTTPGPARRSAAATDDALDVDQALRRAGVDPDDEDVQRLAADLLRTMGVDRPDVGRARKKILPLPGFLRKPIAKAFLEAFIGDTAAYFFRDGVRDQVRRRLRDALPKDGTPVTIVAHSQGTIIALEVLSKLAPPLNVTELVTLGSPLGIREVQDFLDVPLKIPSVLRERSRWHNFADPLDPVAADKGIGNDFDPSGFIRDKLVVNKATWRIDGFNPHSGVGYLAHPSVRKVVHAATRFDSMGRFVVARDVAEGLVSEARQPVLIEILEPGYGALGEHAEETKRHEERERRGAADGPADERTIDLRERIERAKRRLEAIVPAKEHEQAHIDTLRRFVAAHLTPAEVRLVASNHRDLRVYAVWRSARKRKLLHRSTRVLQADAARASYGAAGEDITWAVLDTGVNWTHPHFDRYRNVAAVWDCTRRGRPVRVAVAKDGDPDGHGTHVCGIIAGSSPDGEPTKKEGIAPRTKLVVYKVLNEKGDGEDAWIIKALDHIAEQNENSAGMTIHGVNLSLGGPYDSTVYGCGFTPICQELRRLWRAGVLVVVAAGNEGQLDVKTVDGEEQINTPMSIGDPANLEDCIAVGSVNADRPHLYGVSAFSSRGPTSDGRIKPDVVAPGERISSCNSHFRKRGETYRNLYYEESGTSMAAPHVSGLLAAFLSVRREFRGRPDEVKALLQRTCNDIGRDRYHQGHGIPNLMKMLLEA